jgi:hypothetical protein
MRKNAGLLAEMLELWEEFGWGLKKQVFCDNCINKRIMDGF